MVEKVVEGLAVNLRERFSGFEVYTEHVSQGVIKPCFFVECEKVERKKLLGDRCFLRVFVKVWLESDSDERRKEGEEAATGIMAAMYRLYGDVVLTGRSIVIKNEDDSFVATAFYDVYFEEKEEADLMEKIVVEGKI